MGEWPPCRATLFPLNRCLPSLNPQVCPYNGADICVHSSEKLQQPGKESGRKRKDLASPCLCWAFLICMSLPRDSSGPQPSCYNPGFCLRLSGGQAQKVTEVPSLVSALPQCLLRLISLFSFHSGGLGEQ